MVQKYLYPLWTSHRALFNPSSKNVKSVSQLQTYQDTVIHLNWQAKQVRGALIQEAAMRLMVILKELGRAIAQVGVSDNYFLCTPQT